MKIIVNMKMLNEGALQGVKVLDLGRVLAGPFCSAVLADLGADVIKVEEPQKGDDTRHFNPFVEGESTYFMQLNRNKRGITLDLKKGKDVLLKLVKESDVLVENFRPGTMEKLGLGYDELKKINPGLVYLALSGFGQYGPYKDRPGYDLIAQGMSGLMSVTGWSGGEPTRAGTPICDVLAGLMGAIGILAAIQNRNRTGKGQMVDVSLLDAATASLGTMTQIFLSEGKIPQRNGNSYESAAPLDSFKAADGDFIIAVGNDRMWQKLCRVMQMPELIAREEFSTNYLRVQNSDKLKGIIESWSSSKNVEGLVDELLKAGVPAGPIYNIAQVVNDPHIAGAREMFVSVEHAIAGRVKLTNQAIKMTDTPTGIRSASPMLGQHNREVFTEIGLTSSEIDKLSQDGAI